MPDILFVSTMLEAGSASGWEEIGQYIVQRGFINVVYYKAMQSKLSM